MTIFSHKKILVENFASETGRFHNNQNEYHAVWQWIVKPTNVAKIFDDKKLVSSFSFN